MNGMIEAPRAIRELIARAFDHARPDRKRQDRRRSKRKAIGQVIAVAA
jgi:hypothetical protein